MPANRNALLRYRTLDRCLRNTGRRYTLDDLIAAVSDALYEYEGRQVDVSKRTVQLDLQLMRSDKLGYNAPIEVYDRKYYRYADPGYAITDSPLSAQDLSRLREVVDTLRQFTSFRQMETFGGLVGRLRDQLGEGRSGGRRIIDFEHNAQLQGLHWIDPLYEIIAAGHVVEVTYKSFQNRRAKTYLLEPHFMKESRNRFFLLGYPVGEERALILALDRIQDIRATKQAFARRPGLEPDTFFAHTIGVSVSAAAPMEVRLRLSLNRAPYVLTKPLHASQRVTGRGDRYVEIGLTVQHSFELESELLALGEDIQVVAPPLLRRRLRELTRAAAEAYDQPLDEADFVRVGARFRKTGFLHIRQFFSLRDVKRLRSAIGHIQQMERRFDADAAHQQLEITDLLPETRRDLLLGNARAYLKRLGLESTNCNQVFLHRYRRTSAEVSVAAPATGRRLLVALSRWRPQLHGPECLLGTLPVGFAAYYGQALLVREGMPLRIMSQRQQVLWVLEIG